MRVLVCGGRNYNDYDRLKEVLNALPKKPSLIIQGGARGADNLAKIWAVTHGVHSAQVDALWGYFGRSAGRERNSAMLIMAEYVVAFPGGPGTKNMVTQAKNAGLPVWEI